MPEGDFAESMVAALKTPDALDYRRRLFIENEVMTDSGKSNALQVDIQKIN